MPQLLPRRFKLEHNAEINIVPYIDVMLVLLVIFMMTTPIIDQSIGVDLPQANGDELETSGHEPTVITINKDGQYYLNSLDAKSGDNTSEPLPFGVLVGRVQARFNLYPEMQIFIRGDKNVQYGAVVQLMNGLKQNGIGEVGLATEEIEVTQ